LGFIGYRRLPQQISDRRGSAARSNDAVRIYMECREDDPGRVSCGYVVDVIFPPGGEPCRLRGVDSVLALKKFYKLVFSLEERAREHGNEWRTVLESPEKLLEHLRYTRNARDFAGAPEPEVTNSGGDTVSNADEPECASTPIASKKG
jgi:hypothetical protein